MILCAYCKNYCNAVFVFAATAVQGFKTNIDMTLYRAQRETVKGFEWKQTPTEAAASCL